MKVWIEEDTLTGIADAIRLKKGTDDLITTTDMKDEILSISGGGMGHREVTSIIADGASYIKTGIYLSPYYTIETEFRLTANTDNVDILLATRNSSASVLQIGFGETGADSNFLIARSPSGSGSRVFYNSTLTKKDFLEYRNLKLSVDKIYVDGNLISTISGGASGYAHYPFQFYLFSVNDADDTQADPIWYCGLIDCKYIKVWDQNNVLELDLIPVVKNDGTVCMYNKVNGAYYYNAGTGTFTYSE